MHLKKGRMIFIILMVLLSTTIASCAEKNSKASASGASLKWITFTMVANHPEPITLDAISSIEIKVPEGTEFEIEDKVNVEVVGENIVRKNGDDVGTFNIVVKVCPDHNCPVQVRLVYNKGE